MSLLTRLLQSKPLRVPTLFPSKPHPDDPRIFSFNSEREHIIHELVLRVVEQQGRDPQRLLYTLSEAANAEVRRLSGQRDAEADVLLDFWRRLLRRLGKMSEDERRESLRAIVDRMGHDIAGNFDVRVFRATRRLVPGVLSAVMNPSSLPGEIV